MLLIGSANMKNFAKDRETVERFQASCGMQRSNGSYLIILLF